MALIAAVVFGIACVALAIGLWLYQQENARLSKQLKETVRVDQHEVADLRDGLNLRHGLFEIIEDALLVLEMPQQRIVLANPSARTLFGKEITGETLIAATRNYELDRLVQQAQVEAERRAQQVLEIDHRQMRARVAPIGGGDE